MPNWCNNTVTLSFNTKKSLQEFVKKISDTENAVGLFELIKPIGEWEYHKALDTWGTKWDVFLPDSIYNMLIHIESKGLTISFDTAWGPPSGVYEHIVDTCEDTGVSLDQASYLEEGMGVCGIYFDDCGTLANYQYNTCDKIPLNIAKEVGLDYECKDSPYEIISGSSSEGEFVRRRKDIDAV